MSFKFEATFLSRDQYKIPNFMLYKSEIETKEFASLQKIDTVCREKYECYSPINFKDDVVYIKIKDFSTADLVSRCIYSINFDLHKYIKNDSQKAYISFHLKSYNLVKDPSDDTKIDIDDL